MGKHKIPTDNLIEDRHKRHICFSKRKKGLHSKTTDYCKLAGAQAAILISTNSKNIYAYGVPEADSVVDDYLHHDIADPEPDNFELPRPRFTLGMSIEGMELGLLKEYEKFVEFEKDRINGVPTRSELRDITQVCTGSTTEMMLESASVSAPSDSIFEEEPAAVVPAPLGEPTAAVPVSAFPSTATTVLVAGEPVLTPAIRSPHYPPPYWSPLLDEATNPNAAVF